MSYCGLLTEATSAAPLSPDGPGPPEMEYLSFDDDLSGADRSDRQHEARLQFVRDSMTDAQNTTDEIMHNLNTIDNKFDSLDSLVKKMKDGRDPLQMRLKHLRHCETMTRDMLQMFTVVDEVLDPKAGSLDKDKGITTTWIKGIKEMLESDRRLEEKSDKFKEADAYRKKIDDQRDKVKANVEERFKDTLESIKVQTLYESSHDKSVQVESLSRYEELFADAMSYSKDGKYNEQVDRRLDLIIERLMFTEVEFDTLKNLINLMKILGEFNSVTFARAREESLRNQLALIERLCLKDEDLDKYVEALGYESGTHAYIPYLNLVIKTFTQERRLIELLGKTMFRTVYPAVIGLEMSKFIAKTEYTILQSPKTSKNCHYICIDMMRVLREREPEIEALLDLPFDGDNDGFDPFSMSTDTKLIDLWIDFFEDATCKVIKRLLKVDRRMATLHLRDPPDNCSLSSSPPFGMMMMRELSLGSHEMLLWLIEKYNRIMLEQDDQTEESDLMTWGKVVGKLVMGMLINVEKAAKKFYSGNMTRSFFLMNNYKYIWDSLVQYQGTLREHCEDLLFQGTDGYSCNYVLEEKIAFVRPKCIDYATVYKWEVFGDLLEAVWYDPEEAPPPYSSCMGSLSEPDAERVAFELSVGERFMKFSNGFENLIDPDGEFRLSGSNALYIPDSHLREAFNKMVVYEIIGGYQKLYTHFTKEVPMDYSALKEFDKMPSDLEENVKLYGQCGCFSIEKVNDKLRNLFSDETRVLGEEGADASPGSRTTMGTALDRVTQTFTPGTLVDVAVNTADEVINAMRLSPTRPEQEYTYVNYEQDGASGEGYSSDERQPH